MNYQRFQELNQKIRNKTATNREKLEYIEMLYHNGNISKEQFEEYKSRNNNDFLKVGLVIGGALIGAWLLSELLDE